MVYLDPGTGILRDAAAPPGPDWQPVPGHGALFRRREATGWKAAHAYGPDAPLWHQKGWERVRIRPAEATEPARRGRGSALRFAFAELRSEPARSSRRQPLAWVWVVLPDEIGWETPAPRPGAQARFQLEELRQGLPAEQIAEKLFVARILALGLPLERALWVLKGPPVSPDDARLRRKMEPLLRLASRLSQDLAEAAPLAPPPAEPVATPPAPVPAAGLRPTRSRVPPVPRRGSRPRTKGARTGRASS